MRNLSRTKLLLLSAVVVFSMQPATVWGAYAKTPEQALLYYQNYYDDYMMDELLLVDQYRAANAGIKNSTADRLVERAFWYMENGYIVYGGGWKSYLNYGIADCSEFVSLVYGDFGYSLTDVARNYDSVGTKVEGVYSTTAVYADRRVYNALAGTENLRIGDILTWYKTDSYTGEKYISHVAIYIGIYNRQPAFIGTVDQASGRNPTAIGIINDLRYTWGGTLNSVRRVLPDGAWEADVQVTGHEQRPPIIPLTFTLQPQKEVVLP
ncbi:NlpC/P60 family protein [Cohnella panacarvi]|uniref:NlpC/P60 family protein n=1 Tax=Cohnella panacarvi TaxID=400776 RepID=UPI00047894C7|nr:NlpC/P60 family protein [Cohnella panacarvi]